MTSVGPSLSEAWWSRPAPEVAAGLGSAPEGLSAEEAAGRLTRIGRNTVADEAPLRPLRLFLRQFTSPLVIILVVGAVLSLFLREWADAILVLVIVFGSAVFSFVQEYRAAGAVDALKRRLSLTARVRRDGRMATVPVADIVPGDVVALTAGNLVPADGLILSADDFLVTEAALTGESLPVEKRPGIVAAGAALGERFNAVFSGTSVRSGTATVIAVKTGRGTVFAGVAESLRRRQPETGFSRGIRQYGLLLVRFMVVMVVAVLAANILLGRPPVESILFAAALAIGLSPELLPAIVSIALSAGARAMAREGVIVRRLDAIENLGGMDVLCTDKTGTITEGTVALAGAVGPDGTESPEVRHLAFLNAALQTGIENPLDAAIVASGTATGLTTAGFAKLDEVPYDFTRRRLAIVVEPERAPAEHQLIVKGAVDNVVAVCTTVVRGAVTAPLDDAARVAIDAFFRERSRGGFRVLAVATRAIGGKADCEADDEADMTFAGFLLFFDPPKKDARETVAALAAAGVRTKIVTGDNRHVTAHIAGAVGMDAEAMITGAELAAMSDESLWHAAPRTDLFVEVDPQQKERIVAALQRTGHTVGYLGDGINDAPALYAADVGISVDQAVDVARQTADVVLLESDLGVLCRGIATGRRAMANTLKYISITTSANLGNMVSMALITPVLAFLPLRPEQILLNNLLSDLPLMALATDVVEPDETRRAVHWDIARIRSFTIVFALISSLFDGLAFATLLFVFGSGEVAFQTAWFVVSLLTEIVIVFVLRTRGPVLRSRPHGLLVVAAVATAGLALALPYIGPVADLLGFVPLGAGVMAAMIGLCLAYATASEVAKVWFFRRLARVSAPDRTGSAQRR